MLTTTFFSKNWLPWRSHWSRDSKFHISWQVISVLLSIVHVHVLQKWVNLSGLYFHSQKWVHSYKHVSCKISHLWFYYHSKELRFFHVFAFHIRWSLDQKRIKTIQRMLFQQSIKLHTLINITVQHFLNWLLHYITLPQNWAVIMWLVYFLVCCIVVASG